ncbi:hypothetical protein FDECE_7786 [Fusarium decemcellulare]|nr:hypothetical protein FDECE_7786 [Fusarium decemcellulare]
MVATTTFAERRTLVGPGGSIDVDPAVLELLAPGTKLVEAVAWGASAWTATSKVTTELKDGTPKSYFLKTAKERGSIMMKGEYTSLKALNEVSPGFVPEVYGWGKFKESDTYFLIMDFLDLRMVLPDPSTFSLLVSDIHKKSQSPTGKFGFHVPTCHGKHIQPNDWDESWCHYFTRLLTIFFDIDLDVNGPWKEYENAFEILKTKVVPALLEPLQAGGRVLKPCLVHGDLWEENTGMNVETHQPVAFDASVFYAHNEYELGMWRREEIRIGNPHIKQYIKQYLRRFPPSEPGMQCDDRILLYSIKFNLAHSSGWQGSQATREMILQDMRHLIDKYANVDENQEAFDMN